MTNLIRQKHKFLYHGQEFYCHDISLEDYLLIMIDYEAWYHKILSECNEELPRLNPRQVEELTRILLGGKEKKKDIVAELTETQKKINAHKAKNNPKEEKKTQDKLDDMLEDWHIIEGQMMHYMRQPLSEMRKWPYKYFMKIYNDMWYCTGAKEYKPNRNSDKPDKAGIKKEFGTMYKK